MLDSLTGKASGKQLNSSNKDDFKFKAGDLVWIAEPDDHLEAGVVINSYKISEYPFDGYGRGQDMIKYRVMSSKGVLAIYEDSLSILSEVRDEKRKTSDSRNRRISHLYFKIS